MSKGPRLRVLLAQLPHPAHTDRNFPLAAGYLKASAHIHGLLEVADVEILDPTLSDSGGCQLIIDSILTSAPDVLGFSLYLWNAERSLRIAERIKAELPDTKIIVGGPEVARDSIELFSSPYIDYAVIGEGEITFAEFVRGLLCGKPAPEDIPGLCHRRDNQIAVNEPRKRIANLELIPSPYLLHYIDIRDRQEMMLFTMRGCTEGCSYCSWTSRGTLRAFALDRLRQELMLARSAGPEMRVSIADSAFNTSPVFRQFCAMAEEINRDKALQFNCFVRADLVDEDTARLLKACNFTSVEIGLQSTNGRVLENVNRSVRLADFLRGSEILKREGIPVVVDTILGLPGDTPTSFEATMSYVTQHELTPTIFQLSLGHGSRLRQRAKEFGARIQPAPPFYVLETDTFSREDLRASVLRHIESDSDLDRMENLHCPCMLSDSIAGEHPIADADGFRLEALDRPISNLFLRMNEPPATSSKLERLAKLISHKAALNLSVMWMSDGKSLLRSLWVMELLCGTVSRANPHITWDIHLRLTDHEPSQALVDTIHSFVQKPRTFLDRRDELLPGNLRFVRRRSVNVFVHLPCVDNSPPPQVDASHCIRTATIVANQDLPAQVEQLTRAPGCGILLAFPRGASVDFIRQAMDLLLASRRQVFFEDWVIERLWERDYLRITPHRASHFELLVGDGLRLVGKHYDEDDLLWDALVQWNLVRQALPGIDLAKLIADRAAARLLAARTSH